MTSPPRQDRPDTAADDRPGGVSARSGGMFFAVKAALPDPEIGFFDLPSQKTMYGGKRIAPGDQLFVFASETEGGPGLVALAVVTSARTVPLQPGIARQTPRVDVTASRVASAACPLGRRELKAFSDWSDGRPETELNFKFYRQATNKIVGLSDGAADFLRGFFPEHAPGRNASATPLNGRR